MKRALITGVFGQDGSFLSELLLDKGYEVHGADNRIPDVYPDFFIGIVNNPSFHIHKVDLRDTDSVQSLINEVLPDEVYNFAAQSNVKTSFELPELTSEVDAIGVLRLLEAIRKAGLADKCRFFQASSAALFGSSKESPQNEDTPFQPNDPYAVAKLFGYYIVKTYRNAYGMYASNGILYNHESDRRPESFVTRKITAAAARIAQGKQEMLELGNLSSKRDWGYAKDYVECMWHILQADYAGDFVVATGTPHSVREFCVLAFKAAGIDLVFKGEGLNEKGYDQLSGRLLVVVNRDYYRPTDAASLCGNSAKIKKELGCNPEKTSFEELVGIMVEADLK